MKYIVEESRLKDIADAIRDKTGGVEAMTLEQMPINIEGINTGGGYELITIEQSYTEPQSFYTALESYVGTDNQIVLFVREDFTSVPNANVANNTGLLFLWFSSAFDAGSGYRHLWVRWRDNAVNPVATVNTGYACNVPAGTVFRKVVVR